MRSFLDSAPLLHDPDALRARFKRDGYLFLRGVLESSVLENLRQQIVAVLSRGGWLAGSTESGKLAPGISPLVEGDDEYFLVYDEVQKLEALHRVPHECCVRLPFVRLLGDSAFPHPLSIARLAFPCNAGGATPPHQDYPNNQGTVDLYTGWIPLTDCPVSLGGLAVLEGSHKIGLLPVAPSVGAGNRQAVLDSRHDDLEWVGGDYLVGDMLIFHSLTVHRALPNQSDGMRLSVDYRFQAQGDSLTENCLQPHFRRLDWEQIYGGWESRELAYYWRDKQYNTVPWNDELLAVSEHSLAEAIREKIIFDHKRGRKPR